MGTARVDDTREHTFTIFIEQDEDGVFISHCPAIPGCYSCGDTVSEATEMIKDAIALFFESFRDRGMPIPPDVSTTTVRVVS